MGVFTLNPLLIVLDGTRADAQAQLAQGLSARSPFLEDKSAFSQLADLMIRKSGHVGADSQIKVSLSREEILSVLEPTGAVETSPEQVEAIIQELH